MNAPTLPPVARNLNGLAKISRFAWIVCLIFFLLTLLISWQSLLSAELTRIFETDNREWRINYLFQVEQTVWKLFWVAVFIKLFRIFETQGFFTNDAIFWLRVLGFASIGKFVWDGLVRFYVIREMNPSIPLPRTWLFMADHVLNPATLFFGFLALLVARFFVEACRIKEEQDLTV